MSRARVGLRRAGPADLAALLAIKASLPMPHTRATNSGGFLLGGQASTYQHYLEHARVWLLELDGVPAGYSISFDDAALRGSPLWARREQIEWIAEFDVEARLDARLAYFDQLAVIPSTRARYWGGALGLRALFELFDEGHALVLTTTVREPIHNRAALPYLARVGAREVGRLDETYPELGRLLSAVHAIEAEDFRAAISAGLATGSAAARALHDTSRGTPPRSSERDG